MSLTRRTAISSLLAAAAAADPGGLARAAGEGDWPAQVPLGPARPFSFEQLKAYAHGLAARPWRAPAGPPAAQVRAIGFDAFGRIGFRPERTLWGDRPGDGGVRFFPLGRVAPTPVSVSVVSGGRARPVIYSPGLFDDPPDSPFRSLAADAGFSGFRVMNADRTTDWMAYIGASYFRSADPFNQYGLSARGIAIDTAAAGPEEFPAFTAFWLERAAGGTLVVYAVLDGPSVAGAYRIVHHRSSAGLRQDISVSLRFRRAVSRLGLAPLTSMYWYGVSDRPAGGDWRPQIHDSDGLALWTGSGERIWRPLSNPPRVMTNAFLDRGPRGFGLMQRDRRFEDYQDDGVFYERRPSAWIEPVGDWGEGSVQLVEIPTAGEVDDNIVAFWTPAKTPRAGERLDYAYRLYWTDAEPTAVGVAKVVATRSGRAGRPGFEPSPGRRKIVIDFAGRSLTGLGRDSGVEPVVTLSRGEAIDPAAYPVVGQPMWRLMFDVDAPPGAVIDMRAYLRRGSNALTETWMSQLVG